MKKQLKRRALSLFLAFAIVLSGAVIDFPAATGSKGNLYAYAAESFTLKAKADGYDSIKLTWGKASGAKSYQIYRATTKGGTYKKVGSTKKTSFADYKAEQNKRYYYKIKVLKKSGKSIYTSAKSGEIKTIVSLSKIPSYSNASYVEINGNLPQFSKRMKNKTVSYEKYAKLDNKGRCGAAISCVGIDLMPTEERGSIGMIKPSGWQTIRYDDIISDKYLYNRCHLIGYQLTGENANENNLVTGTRYMNVTGMLQFENEVAEYIKSTKNHVLYRATPVFKGSNLVCHGVQIEAYSVEDHGEGVSFNVFCYNVQPGIEINYADGTSKRGGSASSEEPASVEKSTLPKTPSGSAFYVVNTNTKKFHYPRCSSVSDIKPKNRLDTSSSRSEIIAQGYVPCKRCNP